MAIASVVVEIEEGADEAVLNSLAALSRVSVYGIKDNQIIAVVEGDDPGAVNERIKDIAGLDRIAGVYPVYAGSDA